ncbi:MAG TPA: endo alpha-1,4 polygalactosaminidase [Nocardioides sp.]|nr:endo alpha-1,4 polygalactosaminidase [Nocardioides sp.]
MFRSRRSASTVPGQRRSGGRGYALLLPLLVLALPTGTNVDYQLGGAADVPDHVGIVVRDRTSAPTGDRYDVCYVNGFQTQPGQRGFWRHHWRLVLKDGGTPVTDDAWGEWLLDVRTLAKRTALARIVGRWTQGCADDGFDAVEFDNLDSFTRSHHLVTRRQAAAYAALLVEAAHRAGLAAGQKNLAGFDGTRIGYDFAVAEECGRYRECDAYTDVYGDRVLAIEYRRQDFRWTCRHVGDDLAVVLRDRDLTPEGVHAWC